MRIVSIVGARPQFVKLAPVSRAMSEFSSSGGRAIDDVIVHTGQHYDTKMSDVFFEELHIPQPAIHLGVGSGSHGAQTGKMLAAIETALLETQPDMLVIYGDTNSTVAGALAAAKLHIPVAHIEAGLRSFNREMPEEINRIVSDHVADLLLAPTETAMLNLRAENLADRSFNTGDVMLDAVQYNAELARNRSRILDELGVLPGEYAIATVHRPVNTSPESLPLILDLLAEVAERFMPVLFPAHPRVKAAIESLDSAWVAPESLKLIDPVGYLDILQLLQNARFALTDSGGLQKEALFVGTHCVTLREETEWPETIEAGGNILTGSDKEKALKAVAGYMSTTAGLMEGASAASPFGDGQAAEKIVQKLVEFHESRVKG